MIDVAEGETVVEAHDVWHEGRNTGSVPTRILVLYIGDTLQPVSIPRETP
ncbi:MAG: hypothetical protein VYE73_13550 [Acidobacteriota bacterium]|nr:hypothetical protein [Acidobacteriota bacterium]